MAKVAFSRAAIRSLRRMPPADAQRIREKIAQYAADPSELANQVKRLQDSPFYRLRIGDYRALFRLDGETIGIVEVGHRKDVYR